MGCKLTSGRKGSGSDFGFEKSVTKLEFHNIVVYFKLG